MEYLFYCMAPHQTRFRKIKANKTQQISVKTQVFFKKTELQLKL